MSETNPNQPADPNLRFDPSLNKWLRWNGVTWTDAETGAPVIGAFGVQPERKRTGKGCLIGGIVGAAVIVLVIIIGFMAAGETKDSRNSANATCTGMTYPDQQSSDICADGSGTVSIDGMTVTAAPFKVTTDAIGEKALCSSVTLKNTTGETKDYNVLNFKVQQPSGAVDTMSTNNLSSTLGSGALVAGGTKTGLVCAGDSSEKGQYVLIYDPSFISSERGIWLMQR